MSGSQHPLGVVGSLPDGSLETLGELLDGDLILPDSDEYDDARDVWNGLVNKYPAVVVRVADAADVSHAIGFAREHDLELAIRGGAHHQTGSAIVEGGLVVDLSELDDIAVDPDERVVQVEPGTRAEDVLTATQEYGLACPTGSAGSVGIPGSTLGGGIGWIRRKHGLAIDALRSVEIVTPDGAVRTASPDRNADLYWAVRGGGGNFGVVTRFEFDLYEVGPIVGGLGVFYPAEHADTVLETYRSVMADAPDELTTICFAGEVPALPAMPEAVHGEDAIAVLGCYAGDPEEGMEVVEPLREVAAPIIDMSEPMPYEVLHDLGTQLYPWGRNYVHRSVFVDELSDEIHDIIRDRSAAAPSPMDAIAVWSMGGNVDHGEPSAFAWGDKRYLLTIESNWEHYDTPAEFEWARTTERFLRDAGAEGAYMGFTGVEEVAWERWAEQVYGDSLDRLRRVKAEYDPDNVFQHNVTVEPADE